MCPPAPPAAASRAAAARRDWGAGESAPRAGSSADEVNTVVDGGVADAEAQHHVIGAQPRRAQHLNIARGQSELQRMVILVQRKGQSQLEKGNMW